MTNNSEILGEEGALRQLLTNDFSATDGYFEDSDATMVRTNGLRERTELKSINLPNCTRINRAAFIGCSQLTNVILNKTTRLEQEVFQNTKLSAVNKTNFQSLTYVNHGAFGGTKLTEFIAPKVTYIGSNAFTNVTTLLKIIIPIGGMRAACSGATALKFVDMLTGWNDDAGTKKAIATKTFYNCTSLTTLVLRNSTVVGLISVDVFSGTKYAASGAGGAYVYVPRDLISSYQAATNWASLYAAHSDMFRPLEDYTVDGTTTGEFDESLIQTPQTPLYAVTDLDVSPDAEHPRTITTTAEGHITLESGECSTEKWGYVWATDTYIAASKQNNDNMFIIAPGQSVKITIRNLTFTDWTNTKNRLSLGITNGTRFIMEITWTNLKEAFFTNDENIYTMTYTNTGTENINIKGIEFSGVLMANQTLDFGICITVDDVRYV